MYLNNKILFTFYVAPIQWFNRKERLKFRWSIMQFDMNVKMDIFLILVAFSGIQMKVYERKPCFFI